MENNLPLDPYVLGCLLGDGSLTKHNLIITCNDPDIIRRISTRTRLELRAVASSKTCPAFRFPNGSNVYQAIKKLGLLGHRAWEKYIPEVYMYASIEERWELLRGLMDTDGSVSEGRRFEFCVVSKQLAEGVQLLAESLGGVASCRKRTTSYVYKGKKRSGRTAYRVSLKFHDPAMAFSLPRKKSKANKPQNVQRKLLKVEVVEPQPTTCITVDDPSGLFLTEHFIVTHNSYALCAEAIRECTDIPSNRVLLARKESVTFKNTTLVTLQRLLFGLPFKVTHRKVEQRFIFPNDSELLYMGLGSDEDLEKLKGLEIGFLGIDEASEIDKDTFLLACSRLRWKPADDAKRIKVRLTSNPAQGWLLEDFIDNAREGYLYIPATMRDNPHLPKDYMEQSIAIFGDNETWRKAYVDGDWHAWSGHAQIIPSHLLQDAAERTPNFDELDTIEWGIDCARFGGDRTVLVERRGNHFAVLRTWRKQRIDLQAEDIYAIYLTKKYEQECENAIAKKEKRVPRMILPHKVFVDDIGVGGGLQDILVGRNMPAVGVVTNKASRRNADKFFNLKAEIWWNLRNIFERTDVSLSINCPASEATLVELKIELGAINYEYSSGKIRIEDKDKVKQRIGRSPDLADALTLAAWRGNISYVVLDDDDSELPVAYQDEEERKEDDDYRREQSINRVLGVMKNF